MPYGATELVGLPAGGPTSRDDIKALLGLDDDAADAQVDDVAAAVNTLVRSWPVAQAAVGSDSWPADIELGAGKLGARLWRRRNSPAGVASVSAGVAVYEARSDPDIAQLLKLGPYRPPQVG